MVINKQYVDLESISTAWYRSVDYYNGVSSGIFFYLKNNPEKFFIEADKYQCEEFMTLMYFKEQVTKKEDKT